MKHISRYSTKSDVVSFDQYFKSKYETYKITSTTYSKIYETENRKVMFTKDYLGKGGLNLIIQTKIDILKNIKDKKIKIENVKPNYFTYNSGYFKSESGRINNLSELDINSAYILSAYRQGFLSDRMYEKLKSISKPMRLKALGSIASKKQITEVTNGKIKTYTKKNDQLCKVWSMICKGTDNIIQDAIQDNGSKTFLFYWFDNLFLKQQPGELLFIPPEYKVNHNLNLKYNFAYKSLNIHILETEKSFILPYK